MNHNQNLFDAYCSYEARESGLSLKDAEPIVVRQLEMRAEKGSGESLAVLKAAAEPWVCLEPPCPHEGYRSKRPDGEGEDTVYHKIHRNGEEDGQLRQAKVVPGAAEAVQRLREAGIV